MMVEPDAIRKFAHDLLVDLEGIKDWYGVATEELPELDPNHENYLGKIFDRPRDPMHVLGTLTELVKRHV